MRGTDSKWRDFLIGIILGVGGLNGVGVAFVLEELGHSFGDDLAAASAGIALCGIAFMLLYMGQAIGPSVGRLITRYRGPDTA